MINHQPSLLISGIPGTAVDGISGTDTAIPSAAGKTVSGDLFSQLMTMVYTAQPVAPPSAPMDFGGENLPLTGNGLPATVELASLTTSPLDIPLSDAEITGLTLEVSGDELTLQPTVTALPVDLATTDAPQEPMLTTPVINLPVTETAATDTLEPQVTAEVLPLTDVPVIETPTEDLAVAETVLVNPLAKDTTSEKLPPVNAVTDQAIQADDAEPLIPATPTAAPIITAPTGPARTAEITPPSRPSTPTLRPAAPAPAAAPNSTAITAAPLNSGEAIDAHLVDQSQTAMDNIADISSLNANNSDNNAPQPARVAPANMIAAASAARTAEAATAPRMETTAPMTYTPDQPQWGDEVANRVSIMMKHGPKEASIQMNPPELGRLDIRISTDGDKTSVVFHAQHGVTRDALEAAMPRLRDLLDESGLQLANSDVFDQTASDHPHQGAPEEDRGAAMFSDSGTSDGADVSAPEGGAAITRSGLVDAYI